MQGIDVADTDRGVALFEHARLDAELDPALMVLGVRDEYLVGQIVVCELDEGIVAPAMVSVAE